MARKIWIVLLVLGAMSGKCQDRDTASPAFPEWKPSRKNLPGLQRASLLAGVCPFFLYVSHDHGSLKLLPEPGEWKNVGDQSPIYPSISRDGKVVAYAALRRSTTGRRVAIKVLRDKRHDEVWRRH